MSYAFRNTHLLSSIMLYYIGQMDMSTLDFFSNVKHFPFSLPHLVHSYLYHGFKDINTTRTSLHLLLHLFISSISLTSQMDTTLKNNSCRNTSLFIHHLILPCYAVLPVYKTGYLNEISSPSASLWGMARDDNISTRKT